jgi:ribosome maturation factor RimP
VTKVDLHTLEQLAAPVVAGLGYELVDLEWKHEAGSWVLRVLLDFPESAAAGSIISLDDCARASRSLSAELDVADAIHVPFNLEVSSPGLNRPLKHEADFRRFAGRKAKIRTRSPLAGTATAETPGRRNFAGTLVGAAAGKVRIDVDGSVFEIPVDDVEKANLQFEFGS